MRGEAPYTVPLRRKTGEKLSLASSVSASSASTFERAYSVLGSSGEVSSTTSADDIPYMMQEEENRKRLTPASRASSASRIEARRLMSSVHPVSRLPIGSLLRA